MYPNGKENNDKLSTLFYSVNRVKGKVRIYLVWFLTVFLLISSGITYRSLASFVVDTAITLPLPLSEFPSQIDNWTGTELSIHTTTLEYMEKNFADDYLSRHYINESSNNFTDVYIVYCASRPGGMLGHQPRVCYPGNGWIHEDTEETQFTTKQGRQVNCLLHRFHKPAPSYAEVIILNFYVINGQLSTDQSSFSGFSGRRFNLAGNPARYVAQVQISSIMEKSIRMAAEDMTDLILEFLPDENGGVAAVEKYGYRLE